MRNQIDQLQVSIKMPGWAQAHATCPQAQKAIPNAHSSLTFKSTQITAKPFSLLFSGVAGKTNLKHLHREQGYRALSKCCHLVVFSQLGFSCITS